MSVIYGPALTRPEQSARLPLSSTLVAELRAADPEYRRPPISRAEMWRLEDQAQDARAAQVYALSAPQVHGSAIGLRRHDLAAEKPCAACAELLDELRCAGLARRRQM